MTWSTMYLVCFLLGFALSLVSWLFGARLHVPHLHLPHVGHVPAGAHPPLTPHAQQGGGSHSASPSPYNFATATAFLAWFGGAGYLLTNYAGLWPLAALLGAVSTGGVGAAVVFWFMARVLWSPHENLNPEDYEIVGLLGVVTSPIRQGATGEIVFSQAGTRRAIGARTEDGTAIERGVEVVITGYRRGLASVRTWSELSAD